MANFVRGRHRELVRFLLVGGLNTAFGYGVYALGLWFGLNYAVAALISQILGTAFNYFTYGGLVFQSKRSPSEVLRFLASYAMLYGVSVALLTLFQAVGLNAFLAGLVTSLVMPALSFFTNKLFVFRKTPKKEPS